MSLWLVKVTLCWFLYSVRSLYQIASTPYHEWTQSHQLRTMNVRNWPKKAFWLSWMKMTWRSQQTACIHGTELVWLSSFMVRSWCDGVFLRGFTQGSLFFQIRFYRSSAKLNNEQFRLKYLIISARSFMFLWINFCNKRQTNFWVATKILEIKKYFFNCIWPNPRHEVHSHIDLIYNSWMVPLKGLCHETDLALEDMHG